MDYKIVTPDRFNEVLDHLQNNFYCDETLLKSVKFCKSDSGYVVANNYSLETLKNNTSVMAVSREINKICGVQLNAIVNDGDIEKGYKSLDRDDDDGLNKIIILIFDENYKLNLCQRFHVDRYLENRIVSVDGLYRGQGIAKKLKQKSFQVAREHGIEIVKADATGLYSFNVSKSLGYETLAEVRYDEYLDKDGQPIFKVEPPHEKLVILYKRMSDVDIQNI